MTLPEPWTFTDNVDFGVLTTAPVLAGAPIVLVTHDESDGGWQFLCGTTNDPDDGRIVHPRHLLARDSSLREVADLPVGWIACRAAVGAPWTREPHGPIDE